MEPSRIRHSLHPIPLYRWSDQNGLIAPAVDPITAPHDCMMPGCPGPANKRKLETFDDLLAACQKAYRLIINHHAAGERIAGSMCEFCQGEGELDMLSAAIARAQGGPT